MDNFPFHLCRCWIALINRLIHEFLSKHMKDALKRTLRTVQTQIYLNSLLLHFTIFWHLLIVKFRLKVVSRHRLTSSKPFWLLSETVENSSQWANCRLIDIKVNVQWLSLCLKASLITKGAATSVSSGTLSLTISVLWQWLFQWFSFLLKPLTDTQT